MEIEEISTSPVQQHENFADGVPSLLVSEIGLATDYDG
jgi:hypothetical protein